MCKFRCKIGQKYSGIDKNINEYVSESVSPMNTPEQIFEMYSVPIYSTGYPEYLHGNEIASNKVKVRKNDVLLCKINPRINRVWIVADESAYPCIASSEWIVIRNSEYNPEFLAWYFRSPKFKQLMTSEVTGIGGSLTRAQPKAVAEYPVSVIERQEQDVITEILNKIYNIIDARRREINILDDLIKTRFVEMFGDETNPYNWPVISVEDVADVSVGVVIKPAQYYTDAEHGVKAFRSLNVGPMSIKDGDWVYFSYEGNNKNAKSQLRENDLLIVRSGAPGTACVVPKQYEGCNAIDIIIARPNTENINPYYLCTYTNLPHGKRQIDEGTGGAAQQHFNVGKYNKLRLTLPPLRLQNEFVDFIAQIDKSKVAVQKSLDETQLLFNSLMQKYFG